ncbi:hypothetical protein [Antrihabitans sp. YC2-6]|uniref:hypothetical protein n=1 Tax=Antrihabitans sp. YC2-6 TaxID=2799498 RepID=UPI0018F444BA|nr:hypothetical protein [Antrihabitans sp. YC2-6]MBJ8343794.1 hypothetical protein [Antrihabitans sp. YC2-6]
MKMLRSVTTLAVIAVLMVLAPAVASANPPSPYPYPWAPDWARPAVEAIGMAIGNFLALFS